MCKRAHLENCDPETADQEYCIFHKPNKTEEEAAEFYNKFVLRFFGYKLPWNEGWVFAEEIDARGFVFPEIPKTTDLIIPIILEEPQRKTGEEFHFEGTIFKSNVNFANAVFEKSVSFENARFKQAANFGNALFNGIAIFDQVTFDNDVDFTGTIFNKNAYFENTEFNGKSYFGWSTTMLVNQEEQNPSVIKDSWIFEYAIFKKSASFKKSKFKKRAYFVGVKFNEGVDFSNTRFLEGVDFSISKFTGDVKFIEVKIEETAKFTNAVFDGDTSNEVMFNYSEIKNANFKNAIFHTQAKFGSINMSTAKKITPDNYHLYSWIRFRGDTIFENSKFKEVVTFNHSNFEGNAIFNYTTFEKGASFKNVTFYDEAWFRETKFREPAEFHDAIFIGDAKFESTFFESIAEFPKAIFLQSAEFNGAIFNNKADFKRAFFNKNAIFRDASFRLSVDFSEKPLEEELREVLNDVQLRDKLLSKKIQINFGYKFGGRVDFSHASVTAMKFFNLEEANPELSDHVLEEFINLFRIPESLIEASRIQRLSFEKEGKRDEADRMFVLEMRAKRKLRLEQAKDDGWNYINTKTRNFVEWLLVDLPSEYGTSIKRITIAVIAVVLLFGFLYWLTLVSNIVGIFSVFVVVSLLISIWHYQTFDNYPDKFAETLRLPVGLIIITGMLYATVSPEVDSITTRPQILLSNGTAITPTGSAGSCLGTLLNTLYYSLVTFTTLGYGDMHPTGWLKALSGIEALTGAVFMALIVAVISRKWMR